MADGGERGEAAVGAAGGGVDAAAIVRGFVINHMVMRDAENGEVLWQRDEWPSPFDGEIKVTVPKRVLECTAVSREMNFKSVEVLRDFRLRQVVLLHGHPIEQWDFTVGFVIPNTSNSWQCTIEAGDGVMPAEILSGNVVIETTFLEGAEAVGTSRMRIFYE